MSQFPNSSQNPDPYQNSDSQDLNFFAQWNTFSQHVVDQVINDDSEERLLRMKIESQTQGEEANNSNRQRRRSATRAYKEREREDAHDRIYKDYFGTDGIYPEWATLVKPIPMPQAPKRQLFAKCHSAVRKDVERAFGVLQSRFAIVSGPARPWHGNVLKDIMLACIIMHNMIVEDERDGYARNFPPAPLYEQPEGYAPPPLVSGPIAEFTNIFIQMRAAMRDRQIHRQLQADLIEHVWGKFGSYYNPN